LEVTDLSEDDVYDIEESEYVRKAEVDEEQKETRLQGLKDQLAATEDDEAEDLRREIEDLERRIDELTSFRTGSEIEGNSVGGGRLPRSLLDSIERILFISASTRELRGGRGTHGTGP
jgi:hypothetical protein